MPDYRTPNVYIEEIAATGPIAGVGTSTAAFLGPAPAGPINEPTKITNWTRFKTLFGEHSAAPVLHLPHAVFGYFQNGGTVCYVVRVGTARRAFLDMNDHGGNPNAVHVEARREGVIGNQIQVEVQDAQIVAAGAEVRRARAAIAAGANNAIRLQNPAHTQRFRPGDVVTVEGTAERVEIERIRGDELVLRANLAAGPYDNTRFVRIADLIVGQQTFRIDGIAGIEPGSVITLTQTPPMAAAVTEARVVNRVSGEFVSLATGLANAYDLDAGAPATAVTTEEFTLRVTTPGPPAVNEVFRDLSMDPRHSRFFARVVTSTLVTVALPAVPSVQTPPDNRPAPTGGLVSLAGGVDDNPAAVGLNHFQDGLAALERVDDVNLVCVPGRTDAGVQGAALAHCEHMADRFAILDAGQGLDPLAAGGVLAQRATLTSARGYAGLYYPWIRINDPLSATGDDTMLVPPSGHVAGIFARSDGQRGVHKAPANEFITGARDLERLLTDVEQGELNVEGINVLRVFPGQRPIVWGARTTAPREEVPWRYVNVRRLLLFIEESLQEGLRWAVFEPNDRGLWKKLDRTIREFLTRVWRSGALFGNTPDEAFYVKIDDELNPPSVRALGQVIIEIGVAPVRPAEFVIVRISMWDGGSQASEG